MPRTIITALALVLFSFPALAENKAITCRGAVVVGTTDSGIFGLNSECGWLSDSAIGAAIFKQCKFMDECEITGVVDENNWFISVTSTRKVSSTFEPPVNLIKEAACRA